MYNYTHNMDIANGYIYIRGHESYAKYSAYKVGITGNIPDRNNTYITGEILKGNFEAIYEISYDIMKDIDKLIKIEYQNLNVRINGATEFYNKDIINLIGNFLNLKGIRFRKLNKQEILNLSRSNRFKELSKKIIDNIIIKKDKIIKPYKYQHKILENIGNYYEYNNIGKIIWACGLGKTFMTLFIIKQEKFMKNFIGIPSITLQKQWGDNILKIFPNKINVMYIGGDSENKNINNITEFLSNKNNSPKFIVSTYHSCNLLVNKDIEFDFKIGDEAHHLVGIEEDKKGFRNFHKIQSKKTLFTTATEKVIETTNCNNVYSMNDETIFGKYIDTKSVNWAIENKKITDYSILVIKNTEDEVNAIIDNLNVDVFDKNIFISCYMCLKSLEKYNDLTHILLYTNTMNESEQAKKYINDILSLNILNIENDKFYNNALHSNNCKGLKKEIELFKNSVYGIISCIYIFGEGFDLPKLNGVCIASNMSSIIRIVQYLLRPNRLEKGNANKKAYHIIPYIDNNNRKCENKSYENVRHIISQMRTVDENIEHKIKYSIGYRNKVINSKKSNITYEYNDFHENVNELTKLKMRLRYSKSLHSSFSEEQDEYNYIRSCNISLNINSDSDYINSEHIHPNFIKNPEEHFKLKGVWTNYYHFYGTNTANYIQSKEEWIKYCKNKNIKSLEDYNNNCKIYNELPANPANFYNNFTNIENELGLIRSRRNRT